MFGLDLPGLPEVYTTRQINCVACQEPFTVAEGRVVFENAQPIHLWRLPPDRSPNIRLRHENNRSRQTVRSPARADPNIRLERSQTRGEDTYINCPRCGADNRNWLQITAPRIIPVTDNLDRFLPFSMRLWRQRFPLSFLSSMVTVFLGFIALLLSAIEPISFPQALLIGMMAILLAFLTSNDILKEWPDIRMKRYFRQILPRQRRRDMPIFLKGFVLVMLFAIIFPLIFFRIGPRAVQLGSRFIRRGESSATATTDKKTPIELFNAFNPKVTKEFKGLIREVDRLNLSDRGDLEAIFISLTEAQEDLQKAVDTYEKGLDTFFTSIPKTAVQAQDIAEGKQVEGVIGNSTFLALWVVIIGFTTALAAFTANISARKYADFVDSQLPSPIFNSIADMTRVVIWEAKRALDIAGDMGHIQWVKVYRNAYGGIDLCGLHRDMPEVDQANNSITSMVRAQEYTIYSDMWGRIQSTRIVDKRVPQAAGTPGFTLSTQAAPQRRPLPPEDPYAGLFSPGRPPQESAWISVTPTREESGKNRDVTQAVQQQPTAVLPHRSSSPSEPINEPEWANTQLSRGKIAQLHHELADKMSYFLSLVQIEKISESFHVHFPNLVNPQLQDRCCALIQRVHQQNQVSQLMERCLEANEGALWGDTLLLLDEED